MFESLYHFVPGLGGALASHPLVTDPAAMWPPLRRLLQAHAPSGGCDLPGGIRDDIAAIVSDVGLADRFMPAIGSTGNAGLWLGAQREAADLIIIAHMDRPSYKVRSVERGEIYAICATRLPADYRAGAKALRFQDGTLTAGARGTLIARQESDGIKLHFEPTSGQLEWSDILTMEAEPALSDDGLIRGTGLDNCLGVMTALGAAVALRAAEEALRAQGRRVLIVFSDQEEGIPDAYFGHGAARLTFAVPQPDCGCIIVDAHTANPDGVPAVGGGASHGTVSAWSRGAVVPPNYLALARDLAEALNSQQPGAVQLNTGYLSRSDDMPLGRWAPILGMIGPAMTAPHTADETARLSDLPKAAGWLARYAAAVLGLSPDLARRYALRGPANA